MSLETSTRRQIGGFEPARLIFRRWTLLGTDRRTIFGTVPTDLPLDHEPPPFDDYRFGSPDELIEWARRERTIPWKTWPDVWHLDETGALRRGSRGCSADNVRRWATDPHHLLVSRGIGLAEGGCGSNWLIVETRQPFHDVGVPTELDARAFVEVRLALAGVGMNLIDVMIFDDTNQVWSMHDVEHPGEPCHWPAGSHQELARAFARAGTSSTAMLQTWS